MRILKGVLSPLILLAGCVSIGPLERPESRGAPVVAEASYRGWRSLRLSNGLIELHVVPEIGGRVMQFRLGEKEFLWVNSRLEGALPPPGGLGSDGAWLNYGGDKLWPAPQGWDDETQWPGPPDAVLDGSPYRAEIGREDASIRLESGDDARSGIGFSRVIRMHEGAARVTFDATMRNVDTKPRRWGIWAHTQLDGAKPGGSGHNPLLTAWCPMNPRSRFQEGYAVIFGEKDNPSFDPDRERNLLRVRYKYLVGKVGLDSPAGWTATVDGATGHVFVQRFVFEADREYPDGSSVEFWLNGRGTIHAYKKEMVMADDPVENPCVFESEVLSPFARLLPGESFTWRYEWCATNIGGDFPVVDCSDAGVTSEPLTAAESGGKLSLRGRFGVFSPGTVRAAILDGGGRELRSVDLEREASPLRPLAIETTTELPVGTAAVALVLQDRAGNDLGRLAMAIVGSSTAAEAPAASTGALEGTTGGNERDCVLFARGKGAVQFAITYGDGEFSFKGLEPGEYMVLSSGRIASRIPVRAGKKMLGYFHARGPGEDVPRKIDPAERSVVLQEAEVSAGKTYVVSALIRAGEKDGGWQRNNRARLIAASLGGSGAATVEALLGDSALRERCSSQWYSTAGIWKRFRLRFRAESSRAAVGVELYRWWALEEDHVFVDDVWLEEYGP